jgi:hypothetical protein
MSPCCCHFRAKLTYREKNKKSLKSLPWQGIFLFFILFNFSHSIPPNNSTFSFLKRFKKLVTAGDQTLDLSHLIFAHSILPSHSASPCTKRFKKFVTAGYRTLDLSLFFSSHSNPPSNSISSFTKGLTSLLWLGIEP